MTAGQEFELGDLADPRCFRDPVGLANWPSGRAIEWLTSMVRIRRAEEAIADLVVGGEVKCPCHLAIGQEAIAVGVSDALNAADRVYGGHRSHSHFLALGGSIDGMFAEILGKATGVSSGMGGSMHLYAPEVGFHGSVPIVGATISVAVGAALAARLDGSRAVSVCYFGDGACEEGTLHESLNLASIMSLPVIFVCENNLYSSHLDIKLRQPFDSVARFAKAHGVAFETVDGNDVAAVARASHKLVEMARSGHGPAFLEAVTYRWRGHVGPAEDIDVGVRRKQEDIDAWKMRDPIARLQQAISKRGDETFDMAAIEARVRRQIESAIAAAREADWPPQSAILDLVYASGNHGGERR